MTWIVGNKFVTITTSGCTQKALKNGLCEKCYTSCTNEHKKNLDEQLHSRTVSNASDRVGDETILEDRFSSGLSRQDSGDKAGGSLSSPTIETDSRKIGETKSRSEDSSDSIESRLCPCWCQGWAEIYIRRPTGSNTSVKKFHN